MRSITTEDQHDKQCPSCGVTIHPHPDWEPGACSTCGWGPGMRVVDYERSESEACQRGTYGCCVDHERDPEDSCATW